MDITFKGKTFPNITGISFNDTPVYSGGDYDHDVTTITIEGVVKNPSALTTTETTSYAFSDLSIADIGNGFDDLIVDAVTYTDCLISNISIQDSDQEYLVPYSVNFVKKTQDVENVVNQWSFSENNKIITATHTVSATGVDTNNGVEPIDKAKTFVDSVAVIPENVYFTLSTVKNLISTNEVFDTSGGSYSSTRVYSIYDTTSFFAADAHVINCSLKINYDRKTETLNVNVDGSIQQTLEQDGSTATIDLVTFDSERAKSIAEDFVTNSIATTEDYSLEKLVNSSYNFTVNEEARKIDFSYNFEQFPDENIIGTEKNVLHTYSKSFSVSKDAPYIVASINGSLTYALSDNPINVNTPIKDSARWLAVTEAFDALDIRAELILDYASFLTATETKFKLEPTALIQPLPSTYNIDKDLENITINYSYTYNNKFDYGGGVLKNLNMSIKDTVPIVDRIVVKETILGWARQEVGKKVGIISGSVSASNDSVDFPLLKTTLNERITDGFFIRDSSISSARKSISYSIAKYYDTAT